NNNVAGNNNFELEGEGNHHSDVEHSTNNDRQQDNSHIGNYEDQSMNTDQFLNSSSNYEPSTKIGGSSINA
ncbi:hypothetical protein A2U01_0072091, partial [Trifolium medium]|nr:hypothetical protein [Trifolium medium]